jgi:hypothetical protein
MSALASEIHNGEIPGFSGISFVRSAEGLAVALVDETAIAMVPARDGRYYLVNGAFWCRPRNTSLAVSASSSMSIAFRHMTDHRALPSGRGGRRHDPIP